MSTHLGARRGGWGGQGSGTTQGVGRPRGWGDPLGAMRGARRHVPRGLPHSALRDVLRRTRPQFHVRSALYKMIRNIMGLLIDVGRHGTSPSDVPALVARRERGRLPSPAPAHGLTLEAVYYEVGWEGEYDHPLHREELTDSGPKEPM